MPTYTAQVGPDNAAHLSELLGIGDLVPVEDIGEGSVQVNDLDWLRTLGPDADGHISDDEDEGLQIWISGEGYPLFDDLGRAVADALGAQTEYVEAQDQANRMQRRYATAVSAVVDLAGSTQAAAAQLGIDEPTLTSLLALPH